MVLLLWWVVLLFLPLVDVLHQRSPEGVEFDGLGLLAAS